MAIEILYPAIRPSLDLNFAGSKTLDPRITFTRASGATYYDGKTVAKAEENLLLSSQLFTSYWQTSNGNISGSGATAPDGTSTAYLVAETAATGPHFLHQLSSCVSGIPYTISIFVKKGSGATAPDIVQITFPIAAFGAGQYANFNITAGVVLTSVGGTPTISGVGAGWYRISFTAVATSTNTTSAIGVVFCNNSDLLGRTPSYLGVVTSDVLVWGAQLEQRSQVTAYTPTTTQPITNYIPVLQTAPAGVPRFDHNPVTGESLGLLVEEQRTNLATYSEQLDNNSWGKVDASVATNSLFVAPDGSLSADVVTVLTSGGYISKTAVVAATSGQTYSISIFTNTPDRKLTFGGATPNYLNASYSSTPIGNGWYRHTGTVTLNADGPVQVVLNKGVGGAGASFAAWGAQAELGAFTTSYIKTEASQVTRAADSASMTGANFSSWYRQGEGTLFGEAATQAFDHSRVIAEVGDGTLVNRINMSRTSTFASYNGTLSFGGITLSSASVASVFSSGVTAKVATSYSADYFASSGLGVLTSGPAPVKVPAVNRLQVGATNTGAVIWSGHIKRITYYPKRLSDAQLQALTA